MPTRADGVGGAGGNQVDRKRVGCRTVQFGELDPQQDLLLRLSFGNLQVIHDGFAKGRSQSGGPIVYVLVVHAAGERQRVAGRLNVDIFVREGFLQQSPQRLQVLFDGNVIEIALAGFAPYHQSDGSKRFSMHQHFAAGDRRCVHDFRVAGRNPRDIGRIVDDDALSDRQPDFFRAALSQNGPRRRGQQRRHQAQLFDLSHGLLTPAIADAHYFHTLGRSANHYDLIGRRGWRGWRRSYNCNGPGPRPRRRRARRHLLVRGALAVQLGDFAPGCFLDSLIAAVSQNQLNARIGIGQRQRLGLFGCARAM